MVSLWPKVSNAKSNPSPDKECIAFTGSWLLELITNPSEELNKKHGNDWLANLEIYELEKSLKEIERVGKKKFIVVESYRNSKELFNLQCWALTANAFFSKKEWIWIFKKFSYKGDFELIYFE